MLKSCFAVAASMLLLLPDYGTSFTTTIRRSRSSSFGAKHAILLPTLKMGLLDSIVNPGAGDAQKRVDANKQYLDQLQKRVVQINALESTMEELGDDELRRKTQEFRERLAKGEDINGSLLEEAFAVVREAAW